jgi:4-hydroxythreonine-4-phosphate dehydrogenase
LYLKVCDGEFDYAVSTLHDQDQIAIKLLGFHKGETVHAGLPIPIATPAQGNAFDILGTKAANVVPKLDAVIMLADMIETHK